MPSLPRPPRAPLGALLPGSLAAHLGPVHALAISGLGCLGCAAIYASALPRLSGSRP